MAANKLKVTQVRSEIGRVDRQRRVLRGLGLKGPQTEVLVDNTPSFRGMIKKVLHLVQVEEVSGTAKKTTTKRHSAPPPPPAPEGATPAKASASAKATAAKPARKPAAKKPATKRKTPKKDPKDG